MLTWETGDFFFFEGKKIPLGKGVYGDPVRRFSPTVKRMLPVAKPIIGLRSYLLGSGFLYRTIGKWLRANISKNTVFLDVGCGDLELRKQLPKNVAYNGFDISFSEYTLDLAVRLKSVNVAIASATDIPLKSNQVSVITATEVLEHLPSADEATKALNEVYRVAQSNAVFLVSIPNNFSFKYHAKGQHEDHHNNWTFQGFIDFLDKEKFKLVKSRKIGWWIPFPKYIEQGNSYQIPFESKYEYYNTNFLYMFRIIKN
jgi:ubiquinone/menaquinone biosynthesis C-methylase UbiE